MEQKFKRGNLVKVLIGHQIWQNEDGNVKFKDISPESVGKTAIVEYSYHEKYGHGSVNDYSIMWTDTGYTVAWKTDRELELVDDGGEHLFAECLKKKEELLKNDTDFAHIVKTWEEKKGELSSTSILFLFEKIGHKSSFLTNGEYFVLQSEWSVFYSLYDSIITDKHHKKINNVLDMANCPIEFKKTIMDLFKEVQLIKASN